MSTLISGADSAGRPDASWASSTTRDTVDAVAAGKKTDDDARDRAATTRRATPAVALKSEDFELATRLGPHGVTFKSLDQLVKAPKLDRNGWDPVSDRKAVNPYDRIMTSLRAAAMRRDAALAGTATAPAADTATADAAPAGDPYVAEAIKAYVSNSGLTPASTTPGSATATAPAEPGPTTTQADTTPASTDTSSGTSGTTTTAPAQTTTGTATKGTGKSKNSGALGVLGL